MSQQDSVFLRTFISVAAGIVAFMFIAIFLANVMTPKDVSSDPMVQAATDKRIAPAAQVYVGAAPAASASASADPKETFQSVCFACHGTGAAGAPKFGDKAAWKSRIAQGTSTLYQHALNGFKGMPAKGGRGDLSNKTVQAVVDYMVAHAK